MAGLTKCVRPPVPCRPSKFRLDVEALRSPGASLSGFIARHMEHPASRHSNPASRNTLSSPSFSACCFVTHDPGTTMARTVVATLRPLATSAVARKSSIREFVHEPMKTTSIGISSIGVSATSPMYSSARSTAARSAGTS